MQVHGTFSGSSITSIAFRLIAKSSSAGSWHKAEIRGTSFTGVMDDLPVGGPYTLEVEALDLGGNPVTRAHVSELLVGDLWVMAGQSNMDGYGKLVDLEMPHQMVHAYYYNESWDIARDPLCSLNESIDPVHWEIQDADERAEFNRKNRAFRETGAGLGIRFGKDLMKATGIPVGLIVCSHGGTSMAQWNPDLKAQGGNSLYGSMLRRIRAVGGKITGCLWHQGECDALYAPEGQVYKDELRRFIERLRADLQSPTLPFIYAQLGPLYHFEDPTAGAIGWNAVQNDQLSLESELRNIAMVPTIDCSLSDVIHLDAGSLRKVGARMAGMARRLCFGEADIDSGPRPMECSLSSRAGTQVRVVFSGSNGGLHPISGIRGFTIEYGDMQQEIISCVRDRYDKQSVIISCTQPIPSGAILRYGRGLNPACNLRDAAGIPAPVFGPITI